MATKKTNAAEVRAAKAARENPPAQATLPEAKPSAGDLLEVANSCPETFTAEQETILLHLLRSSDELRERVWPYLAARERKLDRLRLELEELDPIEQQAFLQGFGEVFRPMTQGKAKGASKAKPVAANGASTATPRAPGAGRQAAEETVKAATAALAAVKKFGDGQLSREAMLKSAGLDTNNKSLVTNVTNYLKSKGMAHSQGSTRSAVWYAGPVK